MKTTNSLTHIAPAVPFLAVAVALLLMLSWGPSIPVAEAVPVADMTLNPGGGSKILAAIGGSFTVTVDASATGLADNDTDTVAGYTGYQIRVSFTAGLTLDPNASSQVWPDCVAASPFVPGHAKAGPGVVITACSTLPGSGGPESVHNGSLVSLDFTCGSASSTQTITMEVGTSTDSFLIDDSTSQQFPEGAPVFPAQDTLNVNCVEPPVGGLMVDLTANDATAPLDTAQSSGGSTGLLLALIAGISAAFITATGAGWYARRRWAR